MSFELRSMSTNDKKYQGYGISMKDESILTAGAGSCMGRLAARTLAEQAYSIADWMLTRQVCWRPQSIIKTFVFFTRM